MANTFKTSRLIFTLTFILFFSLCHCGTKKQQETPEGKKETVPGRATVKISIRNQQLTAEIARTLEEKTLGLMFRHYLAPDSGMLFIFHHDETLRFWMKNCYIPLSIAFIDSAGIITDIMEMAPLDTVTRYTSSRPARYALETVAGWFASHGIRPGDTVRITDSFQIHSQW